MTITKVHIGNYGKPYITVYYMAERGEACQTYRMEDDRSLTKLGCGVYV